MADCEDSDENDSQLEDLGIELENDELFELEEREREEYENFLFESTHTIRKSIYMLKFETSEMERNVRSIQEIIDIRRKQLNNWQGFDESSEEEGRDISGDDNSNSDCDEPESMPQYESHLIPAWDPRKYEQMKDQLLSQMDADKRTHHDNVTKLEKKAEDLLGN